MIKHYAVLTLEHLLQGVPEERQEIFVTIRKVEEISYESEQATTNEERCEHRESTSNDNQENGGGDSKVTGTDTTTSEASINEETKVVGKTKTTRTVLVKELTPWGKRFINSMMDQAQTQNLNELCYTEQEDYTRYLNPNINFFKLLDVKQKVYFNNDARVYRPETATIMKYPLHDIDAMEFYTDDNGDICEFLSSEEYNRTWELIMKESQVEGMQSSIVNKKLAKEDKYLNDIKVAYHNGQLCQVFGTAPTYDEKVLAKLMQAEWKLPYDAFLLPVIGEPEMTEFALKTWLCKTTGSTSNGSGSNQKRNGKYAKLNKNQKNKVGKQQQPNNDAKADAHNPNNQSND